MLPPAEAEWERLLATEDAPARADWVQAFIAAIPEAAGEADANRALECLEGVAAALEPSSDRRDRVSVIRADLARARLLERLGRDDEALAIYERISALPDSAGEAADVETAQAMVRGARLLGTRGRRREQIQLCDRVLDRFGQRTETTVRKLLVVASYNRAWSMAALGHHSEAIAAYDQLIASFEGADAVGGEDLLVGARYHHAMLVERQGDTARALTLYDELLSRYGDTADDGVLVTVADALLRKAYLLHNGGSTQRRASCSMRYAPGSARTTIRVCGRRSHER